MMNIIYSDPAVQAAIITGLRSILATTIAAVGAVIVGQRFVNQRRLKEKIDILKGDVAFLLAVEDEHCKEGGGKITARNAVRDKGLTWSGRFTPGRAK